MATQETVQKELRTLSAAELDELLIFIGYLKFRAATSGAGDERPLDRSDA